MRIAATSAEPLSSPGSFLRLMSPSPPESLSSLSGLIRDGQRHGVGAGARFQLTKPFDAIDSVPAEGHGDDVQAQAYDSCSLSGLYDCPAFRITPPLPVAV